MNAAIESWYTNSRASFEPAVRAQDEAISAAPSGLTMSTPLPGERGPVVGPLATSTAAFMHGWVLPRGDEASHSRLGRVERASTPVDGRAVMAEATPAGLGFAPVQPARMTVARGGEARELPGWGDRFERAPGGEHLHWHLPARGGVDTRGRGIGGAGGTVGLGLGPGPGGWGGPGQAPEIGAVAGRAA